jgi:hypothetical protein
MNIDKMKYFAPVLIIIVTFAMFLEISDAGLDEDPRGKTYAAIVTGINKDPDERRSKDKAVIGIRKYLINEVRIPKEQLFVLVDKESFVQGEVILSTKVNLKQTIEKLCEIVGPKDCFLFYYVGQANVAGKTLRINLPGEDITGQELAQSLGSIKARTSVILIDCPNSGIMIEPLTGTGKIIICGCRADQPYSTRFSDFFIPALTDKSADTNSDNKISLLESFAMASKSIDELYRQQYLMKTENALLEDDGDGIASQNPWRFEIDNHDGAISSQIYLDLSAFGLTEDKNDE